MDPSQVPVGASISFFSRRVLFPWEKWQSPMSSPRLGPEHIYSRSPSGSAARGGSPYAFRGKKCVIQYPQMDSDSSNLISTGAC